MFVQAESLTKRYDRVVALQDCTFTVNAGEVFGLLGPNGSGKTTLLRILLGYLRPTAGCARVDGFHCTRRSLTVRKRVAYLPGEPRLFRRLRGAEVLEFFSQLRPTLNLSRARQIADRLGLDVSRPVAQMSSGMRQKLALSVTLAAEVPLLVLDEPTSSLDPTVRKEVGELVAELQRAGRTIMFSSHVLTEVEAVCDRVAILREGRLAHIQVLQVLRQQHRVTARLNGVLSPMPTELEPFVDLEVASDGRLTLQVSQQVAPVLGWLATHSVQEIRVEPIGLHTIYERVQAGQAQ